MGKYGKNGGIMGNKEFFSKNLRFYMNKKGVRAADICLALNIPKNSFSNWYSGTVCPRIETIEMLANYFGIKVSDLIEEKTIMPEYVPEWLELSELLSKMNQTQRDSLLQMARLLVQNNND